MGTVVLPAIIVAAVGLIAGIILTIAAKLMFVPVDERVAAIEEVLPGATAVPADSQDVLIMPRLWEMMLMSAHLSAR